MNLTMILCSKLSNFNMMTVQERSQIGERIQTRQDLLVLTKQIQIEVQIRQAYKTAVFISQTTLKL